MSMERERAILLQIKEGLGAMLPALREQAAAAEARTIARGLDKKPIGEMIAEFRSMAERYKAELGSLPPEARTENPEAALEIAKTIKVLEVGEFRLEQMQQFFDGMAALAAASKDVVEKIEDPKARALFLEWVESCREGAAEFGLKPPDGK